MAQSVSEMEPWQLARHGLNLLINNQPEEAHRLFQENNESIQMAAGYSFTAFMDALMSFDEDKLSSTQDVLKDTESKCYADSGWLKSFKMKFISGKKPSVLETIERQIIIADTQVCIAILNFLMLDFSGYLKGAWALRKAWKHYQATYKQLSELHKKRIGPLYIFDKLEMREIESADTESENPDECPINEQQAEALRKLESNSVVAESSSRNDPPLPEINGYKPLSSKLPHSRSSYFVSRKPKPKLPRSASSYETILANNSSSYGLLTPLTSQLSYVTSSLSSLTVLFLNEDEINQLDPSTLSRLMAAVCFGYGVLQLGISLLPSQVLRLVSFFGFGGGNRDDGLMLLMHAKTSEDMRAPLASLALLWYHTIVRPFYAIDGNNVQAGVEDATKIINEAQAEYSESALFLFFKGRTFRLASNIQDALRAFQQAATNAKQREIKLLTLHEVGWCHLIQLDYENAQKTFKLMKVGSRWSRSFYTYLLIICLGAIDQLNDAALINELRELLRISKQKGMQLEVFMLRRVKLFPKVTEEIKEFTGSFWRLLIYEILYLWNTIPNCSVQSNNKIIEDCNNFAQEPMPGLAMMVQGVCYTVLDLFDNAIASFRSCIELRKKNNSKDDVHISANSEFELGLLLIRDEETKTEGKQLLLHAATYKDYDFDTKLQVRIESAIRNIT